MGLLISSARIDAVSLELSKVKHFAERGHQTRVAHYCDRFLSARKQRGVFREPQIRNDGISVKSTSDVRAPRLLNRQQNVCRRFYAIYSCLKRDIAALNPCR
jgi:hypothetical protein